MAMIKLVGAVAAFGLLAGAATAATSGTTVSAKVNPYMTPPVTGYVSATVTATGAPVLISLPSTSKTINALACSTLSSANAAKLPSIFVSGTDLAVIASGLASGTVAVGDKVNCVIHYER